MVQNIQSVTIITASKVSVVWVFLSLFSRIRTKYGEILRASPYSVRMRENTDQENSEYGYFSLSERYPLKFY